MNYYLRPKGNTDMSKNEKNYTELVKSLLRQRAIEKAISAQWNAYSLAVIYSVLILIVLLEFLNVDNIIVVSIAVLGLTSLVVMARIQAQKVNKRLQREEKQDFAEYSPDYDVSNNALVPSSEAEKVLSGKEFEVLSHLVTGKSNKEIAQSMEITTNTTKNHLTHIFCKLGVYDRTSLALLAMQKGWIKPAPEKTSAPLAK